jgi:hypothetical protein
LPKGGVSILPTGTAGKMGLFREEKLFERGDVVPKFMAMLREFMATLRVA